MLGVNLLLLLGHAVAEHHLLLLASVCGEVARDVAPWLLDEARLHRRVVPLLHLLLLLLLLLIVLLHHCITDKL